MNEPVFHFDVLPVHPQPEPWESLTSYLMRLAAANGITRGCDLGYRLFPGRNQYAIRLITDHVPVTLGSLPRQACCPERKLLAMTFYHLGRKFGRPPRGNSMCNFLSGTIATYLRYCPHCLDERRYYRLPWRFLPLVGCHHHGCRLLQRCGECDRAIPLFPNTLRVGVCPHCGKELRTCSTEPLLAAERRQSWQMAHDLLFLLSPQCWETGGVEASIAIGHLFERLRWQRELSPAALARRVSLSPTGIRRIERGRAEGKGANFHSYIQYARFLDVSLQQLFLNELDGFDPLPESQPTREMELVASLQTAMAELQAEKQPTNNATLRQLTGFSKQTYDRYPTTRAMLVEVKGLVEQQRQQALLERVKQVIEQLRAEGNPIYLSDVSYAVNKKSRFLREHPLIGAYLRQLTPPLLEQPAQAEAAMLARVHEAIRFLGQNGQPFTNKDIAEYLDMVMPNLYYHPKVRQLLRQRTAASRQKEQSHTLERVQAALSSLEDNGQPVTWQAVSALTGLSWRNLKRFPLVKDLITRRRAMDRRQEKMERMNRIRQAIRHLKQNGLPVTQKTICLTAGLGIGAPSHHPELFTLIQPALVEEKQQREQQILEQVAGAIQVLSSDDQPITVPAVGQMVGLSEQQLRRIPRATALIRQAKAEVYEQFEDDLIRRILAAVHDLQTNDRPLTQNNICAEIGVTRIVLKGYKRAKAIVDQIAIPYHQEQGTAWGSRHRHRA